MVSPPPSVPWITVADEAAQLAAADKSVSREAVLSTVARRRDLSLETVRGYVNARSFLAELQEVHPTLARELRAAPADAVLAVSRLHQIDVQSALSAAEKVAEKKMSVRAIKSLMQTIKQGGGESPKVRLIRKILSYGGIYWSRVSPGVVETRNEAISRFQQQGEGNWYAFTGAEYNAGGDFSVLPNLASRNRRIDLIAGSVNFATAISIVGPYNFPEYYSRRHIDWMLTAAAATLFYPRAALVFDDTAYIQPYKKWLRSEDPEATLKVSLIQLSAAGKFRVIDRFEQEESEPDADDAEAISAGFPPFDR